MPVALVRGAAVSSERASIEAVYVPIFRRGRFDQLDERRRRSTSHRARRRNRNVPRDRLSHAAAGFRRSRAAGHPAMRREVRISGTTGRVDWSFRRISRLRANRTGQSKRSFPPFSGDRTRSHVPPFTMIGGDFETVRGAWGLRGEIAAFVDDNFQLLLHDRSAGRRSTPDWASIAGPADYRLSATLLFHHERSSRRARPAKTAAATFPSSRPRTGGLPASDTRCGHSASSHIRISASCPHRDGLAA